MGNFTATYVKFGHDFVYRNYQNRFLFSNELFKIKRVPQWNTVKFIRTCNMDLNLSLTLYNAAQSIHMGLRREIEKCQLSNNQNSPATWTKHSQHRTINRWPTNTRLITAVSEWQRTTANTQTGLHSARNYLCLTAVLDKMLLSSYFICRQCFDAVGWAAGRASGM